MRLGIDLMLHVNASFGPKMALGRKEEKGLKMVSTRAMTLHFLTWNVLAAC